MAIKSGVYGATDGWVELGLKSDPFPARAIDTGSQSVFTQQEVFSMCESIKALQVFTGVVGVGKTTHAKQLAKHFLKNKRRPTQIITASKTIKASGLLKMICCRFNIELPPGDLVESVKIDSIRRMVLKRKEGVALIIDDAQNLSSDALNAVIRLTALQQEPLKLQVVLFGMPILLDRVRKSWDELSVKSEFGQGLIRSWGVAQTEAYIQSRLYESGFQASKKVCRKACQKIHQLSGGVPMQINRRANMMLDQLIKGHSKKQPAVAINGNILWMGALLSALTAGYFSYKAVTEKPQWQVDEASLIAYEDGAPVAELAMEDVLLAEALVDVSDAEATAIGFEEVATYSEESIEEIAVVAIEADSSMPETTDGVAAPDVSAVSVDGKDWLAEDGYTIQIVATPDRAEAERIANKVDASHVVHVARQNQEKYLVVVGQYEGFSEAKEGADQITTSDGSQPWIRKLSAVRDDVAMLASLQ